MAADNRRRERIQAGFEASLVVEGMIVPAKTIDLSLKGILLDSAKDYPEGTPCVVRLHLGAALRLSMDGVVARRGPRGLGVDFTAMDEDSFQHLLEIIRHNAPDPDAVERELSSPAFDG